MKLKSTLLVAFATIGLASCFSSTGGSFRPSSSYFRKALKTVRPVLDGLRDLKNVATGQTTGDAVVLKAENEILMKECNERCARINALEPAIEVLSDAELRAKTKAFQARLASGAKLDDLLEEAFAVVREASWRVLELRHYDVQMVGGMVLFAGRLAEMATGEGKTLAATLPTYLAALEGKGALVVTANEYLARRDAETVGQVYRFLGLSVGLIQATLLEEDRKEEYLCDVTYVTNSELGFDYLRDNLALTPDALVTRSSSSSQTQVDQGLEPSPSNRETTFCLVDEADSILIDEARTPLIISKQVSAPADKYGLAAAIASVLEPSGKNQNPDADLVKTTVAVNEVLEQVFQSEGKGSVEEGDYEVDIKGQQLTLTDRGFAKAEKLVGKSLFDASDPWAPFIVNALKAKALFEKDKQYIVKAAAGEVKGEICIVDTFSGRVMEGRRWSDGLHQSIEAKEGIPVSTESQVIATVTYQSLFRRYPRLCGMSGTASSDAKEFGKVYGLQVTSIPSALPLARRDYPDVVYKTSAAKVRAVVSEVARAARSGRPVLVGTSSVDDSEALAERIAAKLGPEAAAKQLRVLNAKPENVDKEGEVVAQAGRLGAVTVATNMAGRGTDILLGGNSGLMAKLRVRDGLVASGVLAQGVTPPTPMDDVSAGEGGDSAAVATVSFFPCPLSAVALSAISEAAALVLADCREEEEEDEGAAGVVGLESVLELEELVSIAAERAPLRDPTVLAIRKAINLAKADFSATLAPEKEEVRKLGGLYVVGTERHESKRIDNQLRGRSGRQGDPGNSRFFLSLEDPMLKTFGADKMTKVLDSFRVSEDVPLEAKMVTDAIDKVQEKVENYYSEIREQVFTFDDVLSVQRDRLYAQRSAMLLADDDTVSSTMRDYCEATLKDIVPNYLLATINDDKGDADNKAKAVKAVKADGSGGGGVVDAVALAAKVQQFFPGLKPLEVASLQALGTEKEVLSFLVDKVLVALSEKQASLESVRPRQFAKVAQYLALVQVDNNWSEHLQRMNLLKETVVVAANYMQRDVLQEYIREGSAIYETFLATTKRSTVYSLFAYQVQASSNGE